jgi:hypothetical protein
VAASQAGSPSSGLEMGDVPDENQMSNCIEFIFFDTLLVTNREPENPIDSSLSA